MASLSLPRVLTQRRSGSIEVERETFWKSQTSSIGKAINHHETPVKEKHVRSAIIGTYHEKGGTTFWAVVGTLPIQENPIVCWKFCHTLHKLLREGHPNVLPESQAFRQRIRELGKYWGHLRHNFGKLIACYCRLLSNKLEFHAKNPKFPGHLQLTNEQLDTIGEMDINNYFQITVEMFDFMDEILTLQAAVFGSLEIGRANSMTSSGQCRLAPLIPCIQDSSHLYDYLVKLLFKLHSSLPPDVLLGHRDRFYKQFKVLRDFYKNTSILQYFKHLIQIPLLPEEPPNFLIKSDINSHVSPVVVLPPQEDTADTDSIDMNLVDTTGPPLLELEPTNGAIHDINLEKDRLIERLQQEIEHLKREIQRIRVEDQQLIGELRHQMAAMQGKLSAFQQQLLAKNGEIEILRSKAVSAEKNVQAAEKLVEAEKKSKVNEDKFQKMKDVYYKLREEHINLLRAKADVEKQLMGAKQLSQSTDKDKSDTEMKLEKAIAEKAIAEKRAQEKTDEASKQVSELLRDKHQLELKNLDLEEKLTLMSSEKAIYEKNLQNTSDRLAKELEHMEQKHIDLDMEKQELEEMLLAAVDETYMTEQMMKESSSDIEYEKTHLLQERNVLRRKVMEFEGKLENAQAAKDTIQQAFQDNSAKLGQQIAVLTNEKYILEDEILTLRMQLSSESDTRMHAQQNQIDSFEKLSQDLKGKVSGLENQLVEVTEQKISLEQQVADLTGHVARLESEVESIKKDSEEHKLKDNENKKLRQFQIFVSCIEEAEEIVQNAIRNFDDDATTPLTCSPEYLLKCGSGVLDSIDRLKREHYLFGLDQQTDVDAVIRSLTAFSHLLSQFLLEGKATFNATADIEQGNQLLSACKVAGNDTLITLGNMKTRGNVEEVESDLKKVGEDIKSACSAVEMLITLAASKVEDKIEDLVERELADMDRAIEEAASRIAEILSKSRQADTGVKLEVSEKILDTCTSLMMAIRELVKKSKQLQLEIVAQGKGHKSAKDFYKKNHQWTEGLLSAAKAVGMGAKFLVDAADKVVTGQAKFELLVAASQEIAASTAQLVVASKVKADPGSQNLAELSKASGTVRGCTGTVVATVKDCAQMIDDLDVMDFSNLSLHQAKRLEMESQVKVLELETNLEKERVKLSALRKRHYNLAGTGAGWDAEGN